MEAWAHYTDVCSCDFFPVFISSYSLKGHWWKASLYWSQSPLVLKTRGQGVIFRFFPPSFPKPHWQVLDVRSETWFDAGCHLPGFEMRFQANWAYVIMAETGPADKEQLRSAGTTANDEQARELWTTGWGPMDLIWICEGKRNISCLFFPFRKVYAPLL